MLKWIVRILSYVLVAVIAAGTMLVLCVVNGTDQITGKLAAVEDMILDRYIGQVDRTALEDAAASAMVEAIDDEWSYYMTAQQYQSYLDAMSNSYVGIGVTIQIREENDGFDVVEVTAGGSAEKAGIKAGDILIAVDGTSIVGTGIDQVGALVRGAEGTQVQLTLLRDGQQMTVTAQRKRFQTPVATYEMLEDGIGLVTIENFDSRCAEETIAAIEALLAQNARALIFDVRYNPGGYASEMVKVLDYLLPEGTLFRTVDYSGRETVDTSDADCLEIPMAVLVNLSSYSAAEFFAAALDEYDAAVVVGEKTYGKGYFQNTFSLSDGSALTLSVGKYFTPNGKNLAGVGIMPDVEIVVDQEIASAIYAGTLEPMEDPQIIAAINALKST